MDIWTARKLGVNTLTRDAIENYQLEKIKETINWAAKNSPFYGELYRGVTVETWEDFRRLPFTSPADVYERGMDMVCVAQKPDQQNRYHGHQRNNGAAKADLFY